MESHVKVMKFGFQNVVGTLYKDCLNLSYRILSCLILSCIILFYLILPSLIFFVLFYLILSCLVLFYLVLPCLILFYLILQLRRLASCAPWRTSLWRRFQAKPHLNVRSPNRTRKQNGGKETARSQLETSTPCQWMEESTLSRSVMSLMRMRINTLSSSLMPSQLLSSMYKVRSVFSLSLVCLLSVFSLSQSFSDC